MEEELIINKTVTVGTSPTVILEPLFEGQDYNVLFMSNQSTGGQTITVAPTDGSISAGAGVVLGVGGFYQDAADSGYKPSKKRILAVASAASGTLAVHARIKMKVI